MPLKLLSTFWMVLVLCSATMAEDWTYFRGPTGLAVSDATDVPTDVSPTNGVVWKSDLPGKAWSSPVVRGNRIYVTTAVPVGEEVVSVEEKFSKQTTNPYSLRAMCLDLATGQVIWDQETSQVPAGVSIHPKNSHASGTPIVTDDRLFVHFGAYGTAALDLDGNVLWQRTVEYAPVHGSGGSPILWNDQLIFNCDGGDQAFVVSLDSATGSEQWRTPRDDQGERTFSFSTPVVINTGRRHTLVSAASHAAYGYDPKTGKQLWKVRYPNKWSVVPQPIFAGGMIFVCTGYEGPAELLAIKPGGEGDVTESHVVWREDKFVPYNPTPAVHDGKLFMVSDNGIASCRDVATGELHWKQRLGDNYSASPIIVEDRVYFLSEEGKVTVIDAATEFREVAQSEMDARCLASMVPIDSGLLLRTEQSLYRFARK
ncbi:outer membrane biogenesis protein BamB [Rubripirellula amarantea]|uniref:Outer membrane biogenesis protein BamB n=1 Tax=Rubripirellula amarantea TaxID=2527999 RepID=A0A5C5WRV7_9BACT|nr:PQQ-binding-like beta-propeller repeat protein [Rubripirellula amarantea]TWT52813.1 outer membrane biogenesis protein BamB [Rubripirellula amarantea]